jgi:leucyl aminopeptidase
VGGVLQETSGNCEVSAGDDTGVDHVDFFLDGALLNTEYYAPWACRWDTKTTNGGPHAPHVLEAVAYDASGNHAADSITVTVRKSGGG